jgi:hypothetical protein
MPSRNATMADKSPGVDAIEFDNVDAYQNKTGLAISAATQEQFDATIANLAHGKGLRVALKNPLPTCAHSRFKLAGTAARS